MENVLSRRETEFLDVVSLALSLRPCPARLPIAPPDNDCQLVVVDVIGATSQGDQMDHRGRPATFRV
jgi:hypothetical protein